MDINWIIEDAIEKKTLGVGRVMGDKAVTIKSVWTGLQYVFRELAIQMVMSKVKKRAREKIIESLTNKLARKTENGSGGDLQPQQV